MVNNIMGTIWGTISGKELRGMGRIDGNAVHLKQHSVHTPPDSRMKGLLLTRVAIIPKPE